MLFRSQRTIGNPRRKPKDLDLTRVSQAARNRKLKTFKEFVEEAYIIEKNVHGIPDEVEAEWKADREAGKPGSRTRTHGGKTYLVRSHARAGKPRTWAISTASRRGEEEKKRKKAEEEGRLTYAELLHAAGGDREKADLAYDAEQSGIARLGSRTKRIQKTTGVRQSLGHKQPLQPKDPSHEDPGHTLSNLMTQRHQTNVSQQSRRPKPGEPGYSLTRNQSIQDALRRGARLRKNLDKLIAAVQSDKPSKEANLYVRLMRLKKKKAKA